MCLYCGWTRDLQEGLQKTDFVGIRLPDKVEDKGLLAVIKIVIKSLKPQDSKQFDDNIYVKEVYNKLVNWFNIQVKKMEYKPT